jgi:putative oxidoreductase
MSAEGTMVALSRLQQAWEPRMLSILRIVIGLLVLQHNMQKIFNFPPQAHPRAFHLFTVVPGLVGSIELIGGILIVLGLFTRSVAFLLFGEMVFVYFMSRAPRGFFSDVVSDNSSKLAILYCLIFLYLSLAGAGGWSLDQRRAPAARGRA